MCIRDSNYTGPTHKKVNPALRGLDGTIMTDGIKLYEDVLNQALDKLPSYNGICYRGADEPDIDIFKQKLNNGQSWKDTGFMSSSHKREKAEKFGEKLFFKIQSKTGKSIEQLSTLGSITQKGEKNEYEVLFKTNTEFNVKVVKDVSPNKDGSQWYIELEEL